MSNTTIICTKTYQRIEPLESCPECPDFEDCYDTSDCYKDFEYREFMDVDEGDR